jgi:twitching motility protein PilT
MSSEGSNGGSSSGAAQSTQTGIVFFQDILRKGVEAQASDIHLKVGLPPIVRVNDELRILSRKFTPLTEDDLNSICQDLTPPHSQSALVEGREIDMAYSLPGLGRFRLNLYRTRNVRAVVARYIPVQIRSLDELKLPEVLRRLSTYSRGLILVTGNTGSGKSTTLAAMINEWNQIRGGHIITVEDPIEYVFRDKKSIITQREVGFDTANFAQGLKSALRQDPDVIMIGELRDRETIQTALSAAETGHLVLSTLHTKDAVETINRVMGVFDPGSQREIRMQFAASLVAIISQRLVPTKPDPKTGRSESQVPAVEVLVNTPRVKGCLLDPSKTDQILEAMEQGSDSYGSQSFDQHLMYLLKNDVISKESALQFASNPSDFELRLRGIYSSANANNQLKASAMGGGASNRDQPRDFLKDSPRELDSAKLLKASNTNPIPNMPRPLSVGEKVQNFQDGIRIVSPEQKTKTATLSVQGLELDLPQIPKKKS